MRKRGSETLYPLITYLLVVILLFAMLFFFVARAGSGVATYENLYAKKIALMIDQARPGTSLTIDIFDMVDIAKKNLVSNLNGIISFNDEKKEVTVKLSPVGKGYTYSYFTDAKIKAEIKDRLLFISLEK